MNLRSFLRDRALYIGVYVASAALTAAIVQFDLLFSGASLRWVNVGYMFLLSGVGLSLFLAVDYHRQRAFFRRLEEAASDAGQKTVLLDEPRTLEQRLYVAAWNRLVARLQGELLKERDRGQKRVAMISRWAHHMKTPVSVIDLELQKAVKMEIPPLCQEVLESIAEENDRLQSLLQTLLNLNRLDDFAADFRVERVDVLALVRKVINDHRRAFIAHRVYPKIDEPDPKELSPSYLWVESDPKWLQLVLEQIISNAVKYASRPDREGRVRIRFERREDELVLTVADDGVGIAPEDLPRVFEPFYTGANGRMDARATGMGLYLAHEACKHLGHKLSIASRPGEGTEVRIHFGQAPTIFTELSAELAPRDIAGSS